MVIFPFPKKLSTGSRHRDYSALRWLRLPGQAGPDLKTRALEIAQRMSRRFARPVAVTMGQPSSGGSLVTMNFDSKAKPESYHLEAGPDGFRLRASGDAGWYYGLLSVEQLLAAYPPARMPELTVSDGPDFKHRGYMLDVSRCKVPTMEQLKQLIDDLSRLRYNELQLYMEHTFAFAADQRVWFDASPLTAAEIIELDAYCRARFIELVPNLNSFGHLHRWLMHKEYRDLAESPTPYYFKDWDVYCQGVLAPGDRAIDFVDRLYAEFLPNFTSRRLNIGCDETVELGKGRSRELCEKLGTTKVYVDFLKRLHQTAANYGFSVQFWGDIIMHQPELIRELPPDITALEWGYEASHPFKEDTAKFKAAGIPFYVCPGTSSWNSITGRTANMIGNIASAIRNGRKNGAVGVLMTDWGDGGHHQYWPVSWAGLTFAAGCAWNAASVDESEENLAQALVRSFCPEAGGPRLGELLLDLGRVGDCFKHRQHNRNPFFHALLNPEWKWFAEDLKHFSRDEVNAARRYLAGWLRQLEKNPPAAPALVLAELENAALMADLGLQNMARAMGARIDRAAWRDRLRQVIGRHSDLWLARNRPGGLHESSGALRKALETA